MTNPRNLQQPRRDHPVPVAEAAPNPVEALGEMLEAARVDGRAEDELAICRQIFDRFPERVGPQLRLLRLLEAEKAPEVAEVARTLRGRFPQRMEPLRALARLADRASNFETAARLWSELAARFPDNAEARRRHGAALVELGRDLLAQGRAGEALTIFARAAEASPDRPEPLEALFEILSAEGRLKEALAIGRQVFDRFPDRLGSQLRYFRLVETDKAPDAAEVAQMLRQRFPERPEPLRVLARLAERASDFKTAARLWSELAERVPDNAEARRRHGAGLVELGRDLLAQGRAGEARTLLARAAEASPDRPEPLEALFEILSAEGRTKEALAIGRQVFDRFPDRLGSQLRYFRLVETENAPDAAELAQMLRQRFPERPEPLSVLARLAERKRRWEEALELSETLTARFPEVSAGWVTLARAQTNLGRLQLAEAACRDGLKAAKDWHVAAELTRLLLATGRAAEAQEVACGNVERFGDRPAVIASYARAVAAAKGPAAAVDILTGALKRLPKSVQLISELAGLHIGSGDRAAARAAIARIARLDPQGPQAIRLRSWAKATRGAEAAARKLWWPSEIAQKTPALRLPSATPRLLSGGGLKDDRPEFRLSLLLRNGAFRLPFFLDYYRRLGVDRFVVVDNGSTDGSTDYLLAQPDVVLFHTESSFQDSCSGMQWINWAMGQYPDEHWWLHADADEFLVLPGIEDHTLPDYLDWLERQGDEVVGAFMLDMFPATARDGEAYRAGEDPLNAAPYFDPNYRFRGDDAAPYFVVEGGVRERLTARFEAAHATSRPLLTKSAITRRVRYVNSHFVTPGRPSGLRGAFLHFKFLGRFRDEISTEVRRGEHYQNAALYRTLEQALIHLKETQSWIGEESVRYKGSHQLLEQGLLRAPDALTAVRSFACKKSEDAGAQYPPLSG